MSKYDKTEKRWDFFCNVLQSLYAKFPDLHSNGGNMLWDLDIGKRNKTIKSCSDEILVLMSKELSNN